MKNSIGLKEEKGREWLKFSGERNGKQIVLIAGDEEYRSEETLPQLAKILSSHHGFNCQVLFSQDPSNPGIINPNYRGNIPGLDALGSADLMILFTRYRELPDNQMKHIDNYLKNGKPVIGIRTSTHAFSFTNTNIQSSYRHYCKSHSSHDCWDGGFGKLVLGQNWIAHHGRHRHQSTRGIIDLNAIGHPIVNGIKDGEIWGPTDVYRVRLPIPSDWQSLVLGQVLERNGEYDESDTLFGMRCTDHIPAGQQRDDENGELYHPNRPMMPVAWTKPYHIPGGKPGIAFVSTLGASTDLLADGSRRLLVNAVYWCLGMSVPKMANVSIVGSFSPSSFRFGDEDFWQEKNLRIDTYCDSN